MDSRKYKRVVAARRGGPEVLQVIEHDLPEPSAGQALVRVQAASVSLVDVEARYGRSPFPPRTPFTPGYAVVGRVAALGPPRTGEKSTWPAVGERVASLTVYGGYAEYILLNQGKLIPLPAGLDPAEAVTLILNYLVAYQCLHRSARVEAGDRALIIGASGGIGTAFLQLGRLAGLKMYGLASQNKHPILAQYGAIPIDYRAQDFVQVIRQAEPEGLEAVFDGIGGDYLKRSMAVLRRGGVYVGFANPLSRARLLSYLGQLVLYNLLPNGRSARAYGTGSSFINRRPFLEDWSTLFALLEEGKIKPVIAAKFPLLEAARANALLESGQVSGNIVLLSPEIS